MVGLITTAAGLAMNLAGSLIDDETIVKETKVYNPDLASFQDSGLYNTAVDLGMKTLTETSVETPGLKTGLQMGGSLLMGGGAALEGSKKTTNASESSSFDMKDAYDVDDTSKRGFMEFGKKPTYA